MQKKKDLKEQWQIQKMNYIVVTTYPSMCEHVNEMNTMVGSSRTPTIARKGERENQKKKMDNYMDEFYKDI